MWDILTFILSLLTHPLLVGFLLGGATGAWFYRWMLKRDPAKLELWAQEANDLADKAKAKLDELKSK